MLRRCRCAASGRHEDEGPLRWSCQTVRTGKWATARDWLEVRGGVSGGTAAWGRLRKCNERAERARCGAVRRSESLYIPSVATTQWRCGLCCGLCEGKPSATKNVYCIFSPRDATSKKGARLFLKRIIPGIPEHNEYAKWRLEANLIIKERNQFGCFFFCSTGRSPEM